MKVSLRKYFPSEYSTWKELSARCKRPSHPVFHRYGGRGIFVSKEWQSFERFLSDMGLRPSKQHSLDRINNDGPYSENNCRWATWKQQRANQSNSVKYQLGTEFLTLSEICDKSGARRRTVYRRMHRNGWSLEEALAGKRNQSDAAPGGAT